MKIESLPTIHNNGNNSEEMHHIHEQSIPSLHDEEVVPMLLVEPEHSSFVPNINEHHSYNLSPPYTMQAYAQQPYTQLAYYPNVQQIAQPFPTQTTTTTTTTTIVHNMESNLERKYRNYTNLNSIFSIILIGFACLSLISLLPRALLYILKQEKIVTYTRVAMILNVFVIVLSFVTGILGMTSSYTKVLATRKTASGIHLLLLL